MTDTPSDLIPVVAYARASADKKKDQHSIEDQHLVNSETAARLGCKIVYRFSDNEKSAAKAEVYRDDFEIMLKVLKAGKLKDGTPVMGAIVAAEDRLIRRAGDYERFVDAVTYDDGRVYADARGFRDLYSEEVENMGLMGAVASRIEVKKMRRRARRWHRKNANKGVLPPGPPIFGWKADRKTADPVQAELWQRAVAGLLAGRSEHSLIKEWQRKGIKTVRGNDWTYNSFHKAIQNPRLCGYRMLKGELVTDADGSPLVGDWDAIITPEQWYAVRELLKPKSGQSVDEQRTGVLPDEREHRYLLSGILRCGRLRDDGTPCGARLRVDPSPFSYRCPSSVFGGCGGVSRRGDMVEMFVSEAVLAVLEKRNVTARKDVGPFVNETELADKLEQMRELREKWRLRMVTNELFFEEIGRLEPDIAKLRTEKQRHELTAQKAAADRSDIRRRWYGKDENGNEYDDALDLSQKRAYIKEALITVIVHPAGKGNGSRGTFNADLLEPLWRDD